MKRLLLIFMGLAGFFAATPAQAWWNYGHETVAAIAWRNIAPKARTAIDRLLAHAALLDTPTCPARTIEQASTWAECIKSLKPRFDYAYDWHFQDIDICKPFDVGAACKDGNCITAQIARDLKTLKTAGAPMRERVEALAWLIHLVGDLHQPLHVADRGDHGGGKIAAAYGSYATDKFSLHFLWDGPLAERAISTPPSLVRSYSARERAAVQRGTIADWSRESWQLGHDLAYGLAFGSDPCGPVPDHVTLGNATITRLVAPVRQQMVRGGLRLARLLDEVFG